MFFRRPEYFPKQLFLGFVRRQVLGVVPALFVTALGTRIYLAGRLSNLHSVEEVVSAYDRAFLSLALVMAFAVTGISIWTGYRLVLPLGRILVKARSILKRDYNLPSREDLRDEDGQGEWSDLESALHRIGKDMHRKDMSLSREREEIEAILGAISDGVVAVDRQGSLLFYNSQFALFFEGQKSLQGRLSDFFRNPEVLDAFRRTLRDGQGSVLNTHLRLRGEPGSRHFSISIAPLRSEDGDTYGAVGIFHDVTELKRMDQVRIDFVANVSHELRTPLTSIKGYAQTLKADAPPGGPARKFLDTIERNTDRLIALVQDLLSISSLESGTELEKSEVELKNLTDRVAAQLEKARSDKGIGLTVGARAAWLWADENRLEQVVFNLLENAIKYIPTGSHIWVDWHEEKGETVLSVRDNGPGVPAEHHARIFERFYRVDSSRSREQGGTGLGLSIVKHIVQRHGGRVRVRGEPGQGAEFLCYFPTEKER